MSSKPPVNIQEARKILGDAAATMSDEEIREVVMTLDILAKDVLEVAKHKLAAKRDARDLAQLIYDIYQDKKAYDSKREKLSN